MTQHSRIIQSKGNVTVDTDQIRHIPDHQQGPHKSSVSHFDAIGGK